jgi:hypothetical protein
MNILKFIISFILIIFCFGAAPAQVKKVSKTNPMPVYMHYMPWFNTPESDGSWGWHWTMNNQNPNTIDATTGKRQIASHFYPLTGPYASNDPDILEYQFLLMKYAGIDGILLDWYGVKGSNSDVPSLLRNSNAAVSSTEKIGLSFGVVLEDRFATSVDDEKANISYLDQNYFKHENYIRVNNAPLVGVFGPITFQKPEQWSDILSASTEPIEFLPLWGESGDAGVNADGEYTWVWEDDALNNFYSHLEEFYVNSAPKLKTVMGVAYPGFLDFYKEGNSGNGYFKIPHNDGRTLDTLLNLADKHRNVIDMLQLATWNDFGEGTMIEPTIETGFRYLIQIQKYTGVSYGAQELLLIYKLYSLKKKYKNDATKTASLNEAAADLINLDVTAAQNILDQFEIITEINEKDANDVIVQVFPNPLTNDLLHVKVTGRPNISHLKISVNDLSGKVILSEEVPHANDEFSISTEKFVRGVYIINIHLSDKIVATRLVVLN